MTLKPLDVFGWSNKERNYDVLINTLNRHKGKRIIVTVEEEVKECCERWRGKVAIAGEDATHSGERIKWIIGATHSASACYCPECGEKL